MAKIPFILTVFGFFSLSAFAQVSDFAVEWVSEQGDAKNSFVQIVPPEKHHLNLNAPYSAEAKGLRFGVVFSDPHSIVFESQGEPPHLGDELQLSAFLCDDANTYCIKKKVSFKFLAENKTVNANRYRELSKKRKKNNTQQSRPSAEPHLGFIDNDVNLAFERAKAEKKNVFIDFYGIWCPPCNLLDEIVFSTPKFKELAKEFILLKVDADKESAWGLKSKFKVGGYPTLIISTPEQIEVERIVGFLPVGELAKKMSSSTYKKGKPVADRVLSLKSGAPEKTKALKDLIAAQIQRKEYDLALKSAETGLANDPHDVYFKLIVLQEKKRELSPAGNKDLLEKLLTQQNAKELIKNINEKYESLESNTIILAYDIVMSLVDEVDFKVEFLMLEKWVNHLKSRVNPKTLYLDDTEYSIADLDSLYVEWVEKRVAASPDASLEKVAYERAIRSYEKMMQIYKNKGSRGINLELAYYLRKAKRYDEAKKIYSRFTKKYPNEFTFFFSEAKLYAELKDFDRAIDSAKKAVELGYGDNFIRAVESLASIQLEGGKPKDALSTIDSNLPKMKVPNSEVKVRTIRYIESLKKLREKVSLAASKT